MCGLAGYLGFKSRDGTSADLAPLLESMGQALLHRGPDDGGIWLDAEAGVGFTHRRLSIQDLSPLGAQPMTSADGRWVIAFNGEIYNFRDLRAELTGAGVQLRGESDTEVLLELVARRGVTETLRICRGMFALALWDRGERRLVLARDRLGEKPLYYGWCGSVLLFGSELAALRRHPAWRGTLSRDALALYLKHNYVPAPYSIFEGIYKLEPGTVASFRHGGPQAPAVERYWDPAAAVAVERDASPAVFQSELDRLLHEVVKRQMIADVPLGAFLSGGIDSSLIVAVMQAESSRPVRSFTIGFGEREFNEAEHARAVAAALGTDHTELVLTPDDARRVIPELPTVYSEPFADSSQMPTLLVSRLARSGVTVALSGDGGDELFGGYGRYALMLERWRKLDAMPLPLRRAAGACLKRLPEAWAEAAGRALRGGRPGADVATRIKARGYRWSYRDLPEAYTRSVSFWAEPERLALGAARGATLDQALAELPLASTDPLKWMRYRDARTYLPDDILVKVDRAAMAVSLETRVPLLDHEIVELAWSVPTGVHYHDGRGKWLLRSLLARYLPAGLIDRPKMGFAVPLAAWLRGPLRAWAEDLLEPARLRREGWLHEPLVTRRWRALLAGDEGHEQPLWGVLMFQAWLGANGG